MRRKKMSKATICDKCKRILVCTPSAKIEVDFHYNGLINYELCEECKQKLLEWLNER
jgi:RNase P subunit RPR2